MKKLLSNRKRAFALFLALFLCTGTSFAFDFYKNCSIGQRLYYNIIDASNHYVEITHPANSTDNPWAGYNQPSGNINLSYER